MPPLINISEQNDRHQASPGLLADGAEAVPYVTNDRVILKGSLGDTFGRTIQINDLPPQSLKKRHWIVLLVLMLHGRALAGIPPPVPVETVPFICAKAVFETIEHLKRLKPRELQDVFNANDSEAVNRVVHNIRNAFDRLRVNRNLIETGPGNKGYRISTPPRNLVLVVRDLPI